MVGVGCVCGCDFEELIYFVDIYFVVNGIVKGVVVCVVMIDFKVDEVVMNVFVDYLDMLLCLFLVEELEWEMLCLKNLFDVVFVEVGCYGVVEGVVFVVVRLDVWLVVEK